MMRGIRDVHDLLVLLGGGAAHALHTGGGANRKRPRKPKRHTAAAARKIRSARVSQELLLLRDLSLAPCASMVVLQNELRSTRRATCESLGARSGGMIVSCACQSSGMR
eukprot:1225459-Prymnesium_polylepis.1